MGALRKTDEKEVTGAVGRRGIIAGAAALAAAVIAKKAPDSVEAADNLSLLIGGSAAQNTNNSYSTTTSMSGTPGSGANPGFRVLNNVGTAGSPSAPGTAPTPDTSRDAIQGYASQTNMVAPPNNAGVLGRNDDLNGIGTVGVASNGTGVYGQSTSGSGVGAVSTSGAGVFAQSASGMGVFGQADGLATSIGVKGSSAAGFGVYGSSGGGPGVFGTTTAAQNAGLAGLVTSPGTAAFAGTATVPTAFAGFFTGDVFVNGNFTVQDPTKKHGAIAHPDGSYRILYSMESPESWLEDFGKSQLVNGRADVKLDPDFAAVVQTDNYHVFLSEYDASSGIYVTGQNAQGFVVQANNGTANTTFSYRVVAKPQTTNKATRLAKFTIPDIKVPGISAIASSASSDVQPLPAHKPTGSGQPTGSSSGGGSSQGGGTTQAAPTSRPAQPSGSSSGGGTSQGGTNPAPMPQPRSG